MPRDLLKNIHYGDEIDDREALMRWPRRAFPQLDEAQFARIEQLVHHIFATVQDGIFDGPITAGDAAVIAAVMEHVRPVQMIEFGVASGWSSHFILSYAQAAGLLSTGIYLHSFDIMRQSAQGHDVGRYVHMHRPDLLPHWSLHTEVTSATLLAKEKRVKYRRDGPVMMFIDAGHEHPWPFLDLLYAYKAMPRGSWVVLQDVQMMERWIADCILYDVPSPPAVRGVNYAISHWPGTKILGGDMAYNSAALCLDVSPGQMRRFMADADLYRNEIAFEYGELMQMLLK
ncbi:hypothetical protein CP98_00928 [Sphingobium yanoikuyae]|uniref:Class I SAM-dependent methyltransferase n=1 Tax=Sphingobium yanoikuyae TaxID=13690 RepID=A0A084ESE5_SPHYA|nr:class I SAM-dependent methyltransferase [Sphingobium yanoikuyae]KEZ20887.1 hypothetical protein CP98_00928 [Sphingobium yanoikuyae]